MPGKQEARSEETKQAILAAAGRLFADRGFDAVTMREVARAAGCSHTAIYIHFRDKEALLYELSMGPLRFLQEQMESVLLDPALSPADRLRAVSRVFIRFSLTHRNMYTIFFMTKARRVDVQPADEGPIADVGRLRNRLFGLLRQAVRDCLALGETDDRALAYARIYFYTLHGIIGTYTGSDEPLQTLMERLAPTFDLAVDVMLAGFKQTIQMGATRR